MKTLAAIPCHNEGLTIGSVVLKARKYVDHVLNMFTQLVGNMTTTDSQSGYRAYSRRAIEGIKIRNPDMGAGSGILTQVGDCNICGVGKTVAHEELADMVNKELIEMVGMRRWVCYMLRMKRTIGGRLADDWMICNKEDRVGPVT